MIEIAINILLSSYSVIDQIIKKDDILNTEMTFLQKM